MYGSPLGRLLAGLLPVPPLLADPPAGTDPCPAPFPPSPQVPYPGALLGVAIHWAVNNNLPSPQERTTLDQKE